MVTNFEEITKELSEEEQKYIYLLVTGFQKRTKDNPIKAPDLIYEALSKALEKCEVKDEHKRYILDKINSACAETIGKPITNAEAWIKDIKEEITKP